MPEPRDDQSRRPIVQTILVIDIPSEVDQQGLERLRTHLGLRKQGRLSDDWDQEFGYRLSESASGHRIKVGLLALRN